MVHIRKNLHRFLQYSNQSDFIKYKILSYILCTNIIIIFQTFQKYLSIHKKHQIYVNQFFAPWSRKITFTSKNQKIHFFREANKLIIFMHLKVLWFSRVWKTKSNPRVDSVVMEISLGEVTMQIIACLLGDYTFYRTKYLLRFPGTHSKARSVPTLWSNKFCY